MGEVLRYVPPAQCPLTQRELTSMLRSDLSLLCSTHEMALVEQVWLSGKWGGVVWGVGGGACQVGSFNSTILTKARFFKEPARFRALECRSRRRTPSIGLDTDNALAYTAYTYTSMYTYTYTYMYSYTHTITLTRIHIHIHMHMHI